MDFRDKILGQVGSMFMKEGIRSVTMDDISKELGVSKKTIYLYFENKADLLNHFMTAHLSHQQQQLETIRNKAQDAIDEMFLINQHVMRMMGATNPQLIFDLQRYYPTLWTEFNNRKEEEIFQTVHSNLQRGLGEDVYRKSLNPEIIARLYVYRSMFMMDQKIMPCGGPNAVEFIHQVLIYHMQGVMNETGRKVFNERLKMEA